MKREILSQLLRDLAQKRAVVLATELASGEAALLHPFEPGEAAPAQLLDAVSAASLVAAARAAAARDRSERVETPQGSVFLRVFNPPVRILVVGAVHVAQALAQMAQLAGYDVLVVDPRRSFATAERFPGTPLAADWPDEAFPKARLDRRTAVVTLTHDPKIDDPALELALRSEAFYVGALGSKKTQAARRERLRAKGFGDADLARIHGPVGLPIGAVSPGEIAISILAQIVASLRSAAA
jgi:xanthine dehydrogenase accessory factor